MTQDAADEHCAPPADHPRRKARHEQRGHRTPGRATGQERGHHDERQHSAHDHAVAEEAAELLQARKIDEHQSVERGGRRPHAQQHAARRSFERCGNVAGAVGDRQPVRDIEQDDAVHAEAEQHGRGAGRGGRKLRAREAKGAQHEHQRQAGGQGSDGHEPHAAEHEIEKRENHDQGADGVPDALALDDRFGLDGNPVSAGELHLHRRTRLLVAVVAGLRSTAGRRARDLVQTRIEGLGEFDVEGRTPRPCDQQPAAAVFGDVAAIVQAHHEAAGCAASHRIAQQIEERGRILPHHLCDIGAGERQQIASGGDRRRHVVSAQPAQRLVEVAIVKNQQLPVGEPLEAPRAIDGTRIHADNLRRGAKLCNPRVDVVRVFGDGMPLRRRADDVQLIEAAEAREETAEGLNHAAVARQQRQHIGVERQAPCALDRDDQPERHDRDDDRRAGDAPTRRWQQPGIPRIKWRVRFWSLA